MDKQQAIYVSDAIELLLRSDHGELNGWAQARDDFMLSHGSFGLKQLFAAEQALRREWQIPDSRGNIEITE